METQTRLSHHNKFISAKNIVGIFSVSSDDSFYMLFLNSEHKYIFIALKTEKRILIIYDDAGCVLFFFNFISSTFFFL